MDITEVIKSNPITSLNSNYNDKLLHKIKESYSTEEQVLDNLMKMTFSYKNFNHNIIVQKN